jgi:hypothetical protein
MRNIPIQKLAVPLPGEIDSHWFENEHIGLANTLFHRITLPLAPFDSGCDYITQPEDTEVCIEWIKASLADPAQLDGLKLTSKKFPDMEASIYLGAAHNWVTIKKLLLTRTAPDTYDIQLDALIDFETEGIAKNAALKLTTQARYRGTATP